jgi:hypothetical protein
MDIKSDLLLKWFAFRFMTLRKLELGCKFYLGKRTILNQKFGLRM